MQSFILCDSDVKSGSPALCQWTSHILTHFVLHNKLFIKPELKHTLDSHQHRVDWLCVFFVFFKGNGPYSPATFDSCYQVRFVILQRFVKYAGITVEQRVI